MPMHPIRVATTVSSAPPTDVSLLPGQWRFEAAFDEDWLQGKGAFGGVVSGVVVDAVRRVVDPRRQLRSLTVAFTAPARPGPAMVDVRLVREGAWVSTVMAEISGGGGVIATAIATLAAPRQLTPEIAAAASVRTATMPAVTPSSSLEAVPLGMPGMPHFTRQLAYRFCWGDVPGTSGAARIGAWLRSRTPGLGPIDEVAAVVLLDALPPALLSALPAMRPAASVEWTVQFFGPFPHAIDDDTDVLVTAVTNVGIDGYAEELDSLWTADGVLLAQARQTIALL